MRAELRANELPSSPSSNLGAACELQQQQMARLETGARAPVINTSRSNPTACLVAIVGIGVAAELLLLEPHDGAAPDNKQTNSHSNLLFARARARYGFLS